MGSDLEPEFGPPRAVNNVQHRQADITAARDVLGFRAEIDLEEGLRRLVQWWTGEQHPGAEPARAGAS